MKLRFAFGSLHKCAASQPFHNWTPPPCHSHLITLVWYGQRASRPYLITLENHLYTSSIPHNSEGLQYIVYQNQDIRLGLGTANSEWRKSIINPPFRGTILYTLFRCYLCVSMSSCIKRIFLHNREFLEDRCCIIRPPIQVCASDANLPGRLMVGDVPTSFIQPEPININPSV